MLIHLWWVKGAWQTRCMGARTMKMDCVPKETSLSLANQVPMNDLRRLGLLGNSVKWIWPVGGRKYFVRMSGNTQEIPRLTWAHLCTFPKALGYEVQV